MTEVNLNSYDNNYVRLEDVFEPGLTSPNSNLQICLKNTK